MQNGHVFQSSVLNLYLYLCFLTCVYLNSTTRPKLYSANSGDVFNSICHHPFDRPFILGQYFLVSYTEY